MPFKVKSTYYNFEDLLEALLEYIDEHGCLFYKRVSKRLNRFYALKKPNKAIQYSVLELTCIFSGEQIDALFSVDRRQQRYYKLII